MIRNVLALNTLLSIIAPVAIADDKLDYSAMHVYRISKMTDAQIRDTHSRAEASWIQQQEEEKARAAKSARDRAERAKSCEDLVYKERNPRACWTGGFITGTPGLASIAQFYEREIMGVCDFARTKQEAQAWACLPP